MCALVGGPAGQVMGEGLVIGLAGGVGGLILGIVAAEVISAVSPP